ncbi:MAG: hypothetical protein BWY25_02637 [Chloroflexi bacterium ADurb.Bin222]|nr:MAG: hypothetical protein BWY25_02637 [Chloroflexi bacterium ADurb.Bin222]
MEEEILEQFLGIVREGAFEMLLPDYAPAGAVRLTKVQAQEKRSPESGELDLSKLEGLAIMVVGFDDGDWIYEATIIDQAGPILTTVVDALFGEEGEFEGDFDDEDFEEEDFEDEDEDFEKPAA